MILALRHRSAGSLFISVVLVLLLIVVTILNALVVHHVLLLLLLLLLLQLLVDFVVCVWELYIIFLLSASSFVWIQRIHASIQRSKLLLSVVLLLVLKVLIIIVLLLRRRGLALPAVRRR